MFYIMDKIFRIFQIQGTTLIMHSYVEGEFKPFKLRTCFKLQMDEPLVDKNPQFLSLWQDADDQQAPFEFRVGEMAYFVNNIISLFNPQNQVDYGIQSQEEPPRPQNF